MNLCKETFELIQPLHLKFVHLCEEPIFLKVSVYSRYPIWDLRVNHEFPIRLRLRKLSVLEHPFVIYVKCLFEILDYFASPLFHFS